MIPKEQMILGKFVIAPKKSKITAVQIRKMTGAKKVSRLTEKKFIDFDGDLGPQTFQNFVEKAYVYLQVPYHGPIRLYKLDGNPKSTMLTIHDPALRCVEFGEENYVNLNRSVAVANKLKSLHSRSTSEWHSGISRMSIFKQTDLPDALSSAYLEAIENFDKASDGLIAECAVKMKTALATAW